MYAMAPKHSQCRSFQMLCEKIKKQLSDVMWQQVEALMEELMVGGAAALEIDLVPGYLERLCAYANSVSSFPTAVKEVLGDKVALTMLSCLVPWVLAIFARVLLR